jgi:CubicO group peptidase (beta-lactamase class C family)
MIHRTGLLAITGTLIFGAAPVGAFSCPNLETDTRRAMTGWQVPGLALGVVTNGPPAELRTFGVSDVASRRPVTERTIFGIGSIAKSMTALSFAISDAKNELPLDTPVNSTLPGFPAGITIRHLLSHRAGWPRHDALWYLNAYDRQSLPARLARLPRFASPGKAFQYNNVPFAAAGAFLTRLKDVSWDDWIRNVILDPAGMTSAMTRFTDFRNSPDRATPYFPAREGRITLDLRDTDPVGPAAGVYANLPDMTRYLALLAGGGIVDGRRVVPAKAVQTLLEPTSPRYGLGLRVSKWRDEPLAFHPGFIDGYGARISVLPGRKAGVVVLTNMSGQTPVARIVSQTVLDCLTDAPRTDWVAGFGGGRKPPKPVPARPASATPDQTAGTYAGTFSHPAYGPITFAAIPDRSGNLGNHQLSGSFHGRKFTLDYAGKDTWRLGETHWPLREGLIFTFGEFTGKGFETVSAPLADGPTYRHKAGPLVFLRQGLPSQVSSPD